MKSPNKKLKITNDESLIEIKSLEVFPIKDFPFECLSHIVSFYCVSLLDIFRLILVCKKWNLFLENDKMWENLVQYLVINPRWMDQIPNSLLNDKIKLHVQCLKEDYWLRELIFEKMNEPSSKLKFKKIVENFCQICYQRKTCESQAFKVNESIIKPLMKNSIEFNGSTQPNVCFYCAEFCCNKTSCINHFMLNDSEISRIPYRETKSNYGSVSMLYSIKNVFMLSNKKYPDGLDHEIEKKEKLKQKKQRIKQLKDEIKRIS